MTVVLMEPHWSVSFPPDWKKPAIFPVTAFGLSAHAWQNLTLSLWSLVLSFSWVKPYDPLSVYGLISFFIHPVCVHSFLSFMENEHDHSGLFPAKGKERLLAGSIYARHHVTHISFVLTTALWGFYWYWGTADNCPWGVELSKELRTVTRHARACL